MLQGLRVKYIKPVGSPLHEASSVGTPHPLFLSTLRGRAVAVHLSGGMEESEI